MTTPTILAIPSTGHSRLLLAAGDRADGRVSIEAPFLRPIDLRDYHRPITTEVIAEIQQTYDPAGVYEAQLNFDHSYGGPSRGAIEALEVRGEWLWLQGWVQPEVAEAIRKGEWAYLSAEIDPSHAATGGKHYLTGMALLGSLEPAIYGQPKLAIAGTAPTTEPQQLSRSSGTGYLAAPHTLILLGAAERKETPMPTPTPQTDPPATPPADDPTLELSAARGDIQHLRREIAVSRAEIRLTRDLSELGSQVTPAVLGVPGFRDLLLELAAAPETHRLTLAAKGAEPERQVPYYEILLSALKKLPRFEALGAGEMAGDPVEQEIESVRPSAYQTAAGMSAERLQQIRDRYPAPHAKVN